MKYSAFYFFLISLVAQAAHSELQLPTSYKAVNSEAEQFADLKNPNFNSNKEAKVKIISQNDNYFKWLYPPVFQHDPLLGFANRRSSQHRDIFRSKNEIIYDSVYSIDEFGRRITVAPKPAGSYKKFVALFGCSFTFGIGLNDNQTLNSIMTAQQKDYYVYNYAIPASGTNTFLELVQTTDFKAQIPQARGAFVYVFFGSHVDRSLIAWPNVLWNGDSPKFEPDKDGKMKRVGTLRESNPAWFYILKTVGSLLNDVYFKNTVTPEVTKSDWDYACKMVVEARDDLALKSPQSKFIFFTHPFSGMDPHLYDCLSKNNVITYEGKLNEADRVDPKNIVHIPVDRHPNETLNKDFARQILTAVQ
ncbi:MAG: hypothetical protein ACXWQQ_13485, partial [Pseudobdellovibrio sp.]